MKNKKIFFFITCIYLLSIQSFTHQLDIKSCKNLVKALDLNTGAYNKCLFSKPGEKYSAKEFKACQSHYLIEIERLSYIYKNICK